MIQLDDCHLGPSHPMAMDSSPEREMGPGLSLTCLRTIHMTAICNCRQEKNTYQPLPVYVFIDSIPIECHDAGARPVLLQQEHGERQETS